MAILVLAEDYDTTVDRVVDILRERGAAFFRADTAWFPQRLSVTAQLDGDGWSGVLRGPARQIALRDIRSVWYRSPTGFRMDPQMSEAERRHAESEARLALSGLLLSLPDALWVNHPGREVEATKPHQLTMAKRCGLRAPDTLITSEPSAVREFAATHDQIVSKVLGANVVWEQGRRTVAHTRLLDKRDLADLSGVEATAHLFQHYVVKEFDVRSVVVGSRVLSVAIHAHSAAAKVDFRASYDDLTYEVIDPPQRVLDGMRSYMNAFGLAYACFDFAVGPGPDGPRTFWHLEANARGQHGWLERETGLPISAVIADLLIKADRA